MLVLVRTAVILRGTTSSIDSPYLCPFYNHGFHFLPSADVWKVHRKLLTPSFHFKILENAVGMIEKHANIMCQQLESRVEQPEFDITDYVEKCSLDIICGKIKKKANHIKYEKIIITGLFLYKIKKTNFFLLRNCNGY